MLKEQTVLMKKKQQQNPFLHFYDQSIVNVLRQSWKIDVVDVCDSVHVSEPHQDYQSTD